MWGGRRRGTEAVSSDPRSVCNMTGGTLPPVLFTKGSVVNRTFVLVLILVCLELNACAPSARSEKSFDQIRTMVSGKSQAEVERLLGPPDFTEKLLLGDVRCTWWNY